ncbi:MAG: hypothetical protein HZC24_12280, partial [Rhodocyclales bacterium]|nr:hypothetical protein [Rhodocyclales bacterium]
FVASFDTRKEADALCAAMRDVSMRCRTVAAEEVPSYTPLSVVEPVEISGQEAEPAAVGAAAGSALSGVGAAEPEPLVSERPLPASAARQTMIAAAGARS